MMMLVPDVILPGCVGPLSAGNMRSLMSLVVSYSEKDIRVIYIILTVADALLIVIVSVSFCLSVLIMFSCEADLLLSMLLMPRYLTQSPLCTCSIDLFSMTVVDQFATYDLSSFCDI